ncbi:hypothetical protein BP6252_05438 [Coleophoma cylindrospora]|uniref:Uncharacterized protein n=1 Tax=Coleophoma cylindrospora TaxID=1849047 RepID=A0A3D8RTP9_9HELO|nr:hypothetical protein BP6252_05438 [Coleophoma cylindrospora]
MPKPKPKPEPEDERAGVARSSSSDWHGKVALCCVVDARPAAGRWGAYYYRRSCTMDSGVLAVTQHSSLWWLATRLVCTKRTETHAGEQRAAGLVMAASGLAKAEPFHGDGNARKARSGTDKGKA